MKPVRVFIVDDNIDFIDALRRFFTMEENIVVVGYTQNPTEGYWQIIKNKPDLVLLDFVMPEMDGAELTHLIKKVPRAPRVIVMSLHDELDYLKAAKEAGADGFISKTDFSEHIFGHIERLFGNILLQEKSIL